MKIDAQEAITRGHDALEAAETKFAYDRSKWLNASEAGTCIRKQWYKKHAPEAAGAEDRGYARRGHNCEVFMLAGLRAANVPLEYAGKDQITLQDPDTKCSATGDGIIIGDKEWTPIDLKSIDPRFNRANFPKPHHVSQLQISMELIDKLIDRPKGVALTSGLLIYMDASNHDDIVQFEIKRDPAILERMKKRASKILRSKSPDALDREGKRNGGKECRVECDFREVCGVDVENTGGKRKANRGSKIDAAAQQYLDIKDQVAVLTDTQKALGEDIKVELKKRNKPELTVGSIHVELAVVKGRTSLDKKAVKEAGIDLSPYEKTGAPSERLTVKRIEE